jgi:hypothetical protein
MYKKYKDVKLDEDDGFPYPIDKEKINLKNQNEVF